MKEKLNEMKNELKKLYLEAKNFYKENVSDDELKKVDEWRYNAPATVIDHTPAGFPPFYEYRRTDVEWWLARPWNITPDFVNHFSDNLSVMAFLNYNNLKSACEYSKLMIKY